MALILLHPALSEQTSELITLLRIERIPEGETRLRQPTNDEKTVFELLFLMTKWSELTIGDIRLLNVSSSVIQNETRNHYEMLIKRSNWALVDLLTPEK